MKSRFACALLALAFMASAAFPQDVPLTLKGNVAVVKVDKVIVIQEDRTIVRSLPFSVQAPEIAEADYTWTLPPNVVANDTGAKLEITSAPRGEVTIGLKVLSVKDGKLATRRGKITFNLGDISPPAPPTPPTPPLPPPPPVPEPPKPMPINVIPSDGPRVLVVFEKTDGGSLLSKEQKLEMNGKELADYLNATCVKENGFPAWRTWDRNIALGDAPKWWQDAMARPRSDDRWLIVTDGKRSWEGPLPSSGKGDRIIDKIKSVLER